MSTGPGIYWFMAKAEAGQDRMETFYVPYMNFDEINARREKTLSRILDLAGGNKQPAVSLQIFL